MCRFVVLFIALSIAMVDAVLAREDGLLPFAKAGFVSSRDELQTGVLEISGVTSDEFGEQSTRQINTDIRYWFDFSNKRLRFERAWPEKREVTREGPLKPGEPRTRIREQAMTLKHVEDGDKVWMSTAEGNVVEMTQAKSLAERVRGGNKWFDVRGLGLYLWDDIDRGISYEELVKWNFDPERVKATVASAGVIQLESNVIGGWRKTILLDEHKGFAPVSVEVFNYVAGKWKVVESQKIEWSKRRSVWLPTKWSIESDIVPKRSVRAVYVFDWKQVNVGLDVGIFDKKVVAGFPDSVLYDFNGEQLVKVGPVMDSKVTVYFHRWTWHNWLVFVNVVVVVFLLVVYSVRHYRRGKRANVDFGGE